MAMVSVQTTTKTTETTSTGIDVTGTVTADALTIDGAFSVTGSLTTNQEDSERNNQGLCWKQQLIS